MGDIFAGILGFVGMGFGLYFLYLFGGTSLSMIYEFFTTDSASNVRASAFWIVIFLAAIFGAC